MPHRSATAAPAASPAPPPDIVSGRSRARLSADRGSIKTLLAINNPHVRGGLRDTVRAAGFDDLIVSTSHSHLAEVLDKCVFGLIVVMAELGGVFVGPLFSELRNGNHTHHPFPVIVMLTASGEPVFIRKVIDCGPDTVILMPIAPGQLLAHLEALARNRKPFVVTQDYTGPDRRDQAERPGTEQPPRLDVPNPLKARVDNLPQDVWDSQIGQAAACLRSHKVDRYAAQIEWVNQTIRGAAGDQNVNPAQLRLILTRLKEIAEDLSARTEKELIPASLLQDLTAVADSLIAADTPSRHREIGALTRACGDLAEALGKRLGRNSGQPFAAAAQ